MSQYFKWINSKYRDEDSPPPFPYVKRRSNSLDPRSLEASGLRQFVVIQNNVGFYIIIRLVEVDLKKMEKLILMLFHKNHVCCLIYYVLITYPVLQMYLFTIITKILINMFILSFCYIYTGCDYSKVISG